MSAPSPPSPSLAAAMPPLRVGDLVEVLPLEAVLATLDGDAAIAGMPFMPEMAAFCGRRFRVAKTAHKTCDATGWIYARALPDAVHLDTRCDGAFHDDCEAGCRLFWKTAWLRRIDDAAPAENLAVPSDPTRHTAAMRRLEATARSIRDGEIVHRCQATEIGRATTPLHPWDLGQYRDDLAGGNVAPTTLVATFAVSVPRVIRSKFGKLRRRLALRLLGARRRTSREDPPLDLVPGERVRVKSQTEILATLNEERKNFGLSFDADMVRFCGTIRRVGARIHRIIDERTGRMIRFRRPVIALDDVTCSGLHYPTRLFCPRAMHTFWRESWLERVDAARPTPPDSKPEV